MKKLTQMPPEVAQVFGSAAPKFVDYLADVMSNQADEVQTMSALSFEKKLTEEVSGLRLEMAELRADMRTEMADLRADVRLEIAEMRNETQASIAELRSELKDEIHTQIAGVNGQIVGLHQNIAGLHEKFSDMHKQIADVHKQIASQTKWLLAMMLAAVTLYPIINQLVQRYL